MIFQHKEDKSVYNYDTKNKKFYYTNTFNVAGPTSWDWTYNIKEGRCTVIAPNCLGVWYDK